MKIKNKKIIVYIIFGILLLALLLSFVPVFNRDEEKDDSNDPGTTYTGTVWRFKTDVTNKKMLSYTELLDSSSTGTVSIPLSFTCSLSGDTKHGAISLEFTENEDAVNVWTVAAYQQIGFGDSDPSVTYNFSPCTITLLDEPSTVAFSFLKEFCVMVDANYSFDDLYVFNEDIEVLDISDFILANAHVSETTSAGLTKRTAEVEFVFYTDSRFVDYALSSYKKIKLVCWENAEEITSASIFAVDDNGNEIPVVVISGDEVVRGISVIRIPSGSLSEEASAFLSAFTYKYSAENSTSYINTTWEFKSGLTYEDVSAFYENYRGSFEEGEVYISLPLQTNVELSPRAVDSTEPNETVFEGGVTIFYCCDLDVGYFASFEASQNGRGGGYYALADFDQDGTNVLYADSMKLIGEPSELGLAFLLHFCNLV